MGVMMKTLRAISAWRLATLASSALLFNACDNKDDGPIDHTGCESNADCSTDQICDDGICVEPPVSGDYCGDGFLNPDEKCDTAIQSPFTGSCPTQCNNTNDRCGVYELIDDECQTRCERTSEITEFIDGDLCCPQGATVGDDADCAIVCGDGIVSGDEACDDGELNGTTAHCNDTCSDTIPGICGDGIVDWNEGCDDGEETASCNGNCTVSTCGDTIPNPTAGEECDDGEETATCNADCTVASCGDGVLNAAAGETCDDGEDNGQPNKCNDTCTGTTASVCGNSVLESGETCDDGGVNTASCNSDCTAPACGDGLHNAATGEACDDGHSSNGDGCLNDCTLPVCGDGFVQSGVETCDDGTENGQPNKCNATCTGTTSADCGNHAVEAGEDCDEGGVNTATCNADCSLPACGDGIRNPAAGEACDDGNASNDDGCLNSCEVASCGDGLINAGVETCDDGAENGQPNKCNATCSGTTVAVCGNGVQESGEDCDDNGESATCTATCTISECGDGIVNASAGETCDDGGDNGSPNHCNATCSGTTAAVCGNGVQEGTEACDDGSESATCNADCTAASCGDGIVNATAGEACDDSGESATCNVNCTVASCGDGTVNTTAGEECDTGGASATCSATCETITPTTGFRVDTARIIDPHVYVSFIACIDVTNSGLFGQLPNGVNGMLSESLTEVEDGEYGFNIVLTATPFTTTNGTTMPATLEFPSCFASPLSCVRDATQPIIDADITYQTSGSCLPTPPPGRNASYTGLHAPNGNCFQSTPQTVVISVADIPITLTDARIAAKVTGTAPNRTLTDGVLYGFFSEEDADAAMLPADLPLFGGDPISDLLGGGGGCGPGSDAEEYEGVKGWWFYLNFTAKEVPFEFE